MNNDKDNVKKVAFSNIEKIAEKIFSEIDDIQNIVVAVELKSDKQVHCFWSEMTRSKLIFIAKVLEVDAWEDGI